MRPSRSGRLRLGSAGGVGLQSHGVYQSQLFALGLGAVKKHLQLVGVRDGMSCCADNAACVTEWFPQTLWYRMPSVF